MDVLAAILKPDPQCSSATGEKKELRGPLNSFSCGRVLGASFQDRCKPTPGRCGANFLFATLLKTRPQPPTFASHKVLR